MTYASGGHGGTDHIDYFDPIQTDKWLSIVGNNTFVKGGARGYMLVSFGPDRALGISGGTYLDDFRTTTPLGYPTETDLTLGTDKYFYDPTNGTISTGNIYRFSGGLTQSEILQGSAAATEP